MTAQRNKAIPLYYQLEIDLRRRLSSKEFGPGDILPSEAEIGQQYQVSRITVRQALAALEREGLISRQPGRGTFVTDKVQRLWTPKLTGSLEDAIMLGLTDKYEVRLVKREELTASEWESRVFDLPPHGKVHRIERIRLYDGKPLARMVNVLPADVASRLKTADFLKRPVMANLERLKLKLSEADQSIGATLADSETAGLLEIKTGDPLLQMERTVYEESGRAVNHVVVLFRADRYWYRVKLKREGQGGQRDWSLA